MGTIYNLGCYPVSLVHFIMETAFGPDAFKSRQVVGLGNISTEAPVHVRDASLNVRFDAGVQSTDSFGNDFFFSIQGDKAVLKGTKEEIVVKSDMDAFGHQVKRVEECVSKGVKEAPRPSPNSAHSLEIMGLLTEWEADIKQRYNL
ncbi:hypothetical protein V1525DRAFT_390970 [Lipomyces kononenkoae]|uniref:Uncharacterized protein n=1 Tax=Lipomyces kononenkoae TaxID=34357 RepID=A0ACC3STG2_LIPKO